MRNVLAVIPKGSQDMVASIIRAIWPARALEHGPDGLGHDPVADAGLAVGGVEEHVGEVLRGEGAVTELGHLSVQARADPGHFRRGDPGIRAEGIDQVVDFPGRDAVDISLHHDREQGLVHPPATLEQGREERPGVQLRDLQIQFPGRRAEGARSGAVAVGRAVARALEWGGADERGRFRIDEVLVESFGRDADSVGDVGEFAFSEEVEQGRLVPTQRQRHRQIHDDFGRVMDRQRLTPTRQRRRHRRTQPAATIASVNSTPPALPTAPEF